MSHNKAFWTGELVQIDENTWEVRHPVPPGDKQKAGMARNKKAGKKPVSTKKKVVYNYFWDPVKKVILNSRREIIVRDLEITSTRQDGDFTQVFLRFSMDGKEYTAKTIKGVKNALVLRRGRKVVKKCACGALLKYDSTTGMCQKCRPIATAKKQKACTTCGKTLRAANKTGLCRKHFQETQHEENKRTGFNPFLAS